MPKKNTAPLGKRKLREAIEDAWYDAPSASAGFGRIEVIIEQQIKADRYKQVEAVLDRLSVETKRTYDREGDFLEGVIDAIEAERNRLNPSIKGKE